jgi:AcrR family transcriptional regulator
MKYGVNVMKDVKTLTSRDIQAIERRKQLLASAKTLFANNGFHNTSIRDIVHNAGIASGLIYHYFPKGKQEILDTIIKEGHDIIINNVNETLKNAKSNKITLRDSLTIIGNIAKNSVVSDPELTQIVIHEKNFIDNSCRESIEDIGPRLSSIMMELLQEKANAGEIKKMNYKMAMLVMVSTFYYVNMIESSGSVPSVQVEISEIVDYLLELWKP